LFEKYGDKRDYRKIDIYLNGKYDSSTNWASSLKQAKEKYLEKNKDVDASSVKTEYSK